MQLKFSTLLPFIVASLASAAPIEERTPSSTVKGFDVSHYQAGANLATAKANGASFVIIKATEGTTYKDPSFSDFYGQATNAGLIRGGYHFANPSSSSGAAQASFFLKNGGNWSGDGRTLPGMLDLESEGNNPQCWGLSQAGMINWVKDFGNTYKATAGRLPMIYSNAGWLNSCLGGSSALSDAGYPLVIAHYTSASTPGDTPGWPYASFWQWADSGTFPGDQDVWQGSQANLVKFATG